mmetsp:Transcript_9497/g.21090  ORF Transcript_9497/g.21090 Transcript_9497/m.21090 type:complete len:134 (-) Transcript_9497:17-418(-)
MEPSQRHLGFNCGRMELAFDRGAVVAREAEQPAAPDARLAAAIRELPRDHVEWEARLQQQEEQAPFSRLARAGLARTGLKHGPMRGGSGLEALARRCNDTELREPGTAMPMHPCREGACFPLDFVPRRGAALP